MVRLQEIPSGWLDRIRLKIKQNCRLFLDIFVSAIMNDLFMTFTSRLKVDVNVFISSEIGSQWPTILGRLPADWVHGYLYCEPGAWIWTNGFRRYLPFVKNWSGKKNLYIQEGYVPLDGLCLEFFRDFFVFLGESVGQMIYREYIVFRGSNISCSLATTKSETADNAAFPA